MGFEVTLLRWSEEDGGGVRILGRTRDEEVVEVVRSHLAAQLATPPEDEHGPRLLPIEGGRRPEEADE